MHSTYSYKQGTCHFQYAFLFICKLCISVSPSISRKFHTDVCWAQYNMTKRSWQFDKFGNDCRLSAQSDQASVWIGLVLLSLSIVKTGLLIMKTNIKVQWRLWYTYLFYEAYFITECLNPLFILTAGVPTTVNISISSCGRGLHFI